ncbi:M23 family metallopeptidase [Catellatospora sp. KI3]|uniref:M23 family metallopeptidase n=1 Tax=Catellatospora sp. KI3 TaxID=3041620 RepID=UPI002482DF26|nr:M23 family metallopeptidase [Catellatospora sp. KI3]MDI1463036.1 M23 family metallopeptidase [Catellatospora sp. KI3]
MQYRPALSKESDRYRGRRRVDTPPRHRYVAVLATAVAGAGVVAFGAGATVDDGKADPYAVEISAYSTGVADRADTVDRASRSDTREAVATTDDRDPNAWVLPLHDFKLTSRFKSDWNQTHQGVDLVGPAEGTAIGALHRGTVVQAGWNGAYGYSVVVDHGDGIRSLYGHASKVLVKVGQRVEAGQTVGLLGNTGLSYGTHLRLEVYVSGVPQNTLEWLREQKVDLELEIEAVLGS